MKLIQSILLVPILAMTACSDHGLMDDMPDNGVDGSATFLISTPGSYGIETSSRAGDTEAVEDSTSTDTALPTGMADLKFLLSDSEGNILDHHYARLESDFSRLTIEGLKSGRYSLLFLAAGNGSVIDDTGTPAVSSDPWLTNPDGNRPVNATLFHKKIDFSVTAGQAQEARKVELDLAVAKVDVRIKTDNPSLHRYIKSVSVSINDRIPVSLNADGSYSGGNEIDSYNVAEVSGSYPFTLFPSEKPVDGYVDIVSSLESGDTFTTRYPFSGLTLCKGKVSRIDVAYRHPESKSGRLYVTSGQLWRFDTDTMFMSDEPREVFYDNSRRSFYVNESLQFNISDKGTLDVKLFSPIGVRDIRVLGRFRNISNEWVDLAFFESIPAFMEGSFELPVTSNECLFKTVSGRNIRIPAQPGLKSGDVELKIETDDPFLAKIATIDSHWYIRFSKFGADNGHASWRHMTPILCRHGVALALNMAFMFASPEFSEALDTYDGILKDNSGNPIDLNALRNRIRTHGGLQLGRVVGVGGLGGGQTYGLADYCYTGVYHDATAPGSNPHNYARQAMFHEYGHCLGYNHSSNMTYGDKWTVLCATVFVEMGRDGKLPVPNLTDVTSLPYNR